MTLDELLQKNRLTQRAVIREAECIGCTKCIQACPVDAIIGASKQMHTILADVCIGCELCIPPCPVDCIDLTPRTGVDAAQSQHLTQQAQERFQQREARTAREAQQQQATHATQHQTLAARRTAIQAAVQRSQAKRTI